MPNTSLEHFFGIEEKITLTKNGQWLSNGEEITHPGTLAAFSKNIYRTENGFEIRLGLGEKQEKKEITVEDTIYFVISLRGSPETGFLLLLNDKRQITLDPTSLKYKYERLTCHVPHHESGIEEARFLSAAYYEILSYFAEDQVGFSLNIKDKTIRL